MIRRLFGLLVQMTPWLPVPVFADGPELNTRYVTSWNLGPWVKVRHPEPLEINAVRYRLLPGNRKTARWTVCRVVSMGRLLPGGPR